MTERIHADAKRGREREREQAVFLGRAKKRGPAEPYYGFTGRSRTRRHYRLANNMRHGHTLNHGTKDSADIHIVEWGPRDFNLSRFPRREY